MSVNTSGNWKQFVIMLLKLGACNSSKEIANTINRHSEFDVSWQQVAGVIANETKKNKQ